MGEIEKMNTITITGESSLEVQYLVALARIKSPEFYALTDSEIIEALIEKVISGEVQA